MAKPISALIVLILFVMGVCFGQNSPASTTAEVKGMVSDGTGAVIGRAKVTFDNGSATTSVETNSNGSFHVTLPSGTYAVTVSQVGFKTVKFVNFRLQSTTRALLNAVLQVENADGGLAYTDPDPPQVPTTNSELPWIIQGSTAEPSLGQGGASAKAATPSKLKN
jgi:hypothetical protein